MEKAEITSHLTELYWKPTQDLGNEQKQSVAQLLNRIQDSFSRIEWDLALTHLHHKTPIKQPPRWVPMANPQDEKRAVQYLRAKGVIRESTFPETSLIVPIKKKDGGDQPCVN